MKFIYLDQKVWIALARSIVRKTADVNFLNKIREKIDIGEWAFPLSIEHLIETSKRLDDRTRNELATVMGKFSKNYTIAPYPTYKHKEFLLSTLSLNGTIDNKLPLKDSIIKQDYANIVGLNFENMKITSKYLSENETEKYTAELLQYLKATDLFSIYANYFSSGKFADDIQEDVKFFAETYEEYRKELHTTIPEKHKTYRYKIFLANRFCDLQEEIIKLGFDIDKLLPKTLFETAESTMRCLSETPSFYVNTTLTFEILNSKDRKFTGNDYYDISFLSAAIPYCDIVITEISWASIAKKYKLHTKYNTKIYNKLDGLMKE